MSIIDAKTLKSRKQLTRYMLLGGVFGLLFGVIHLLSYFGSGSTIALSDAIINATVGILSLVGAWLITKGKVIAVAIAVIIIVASVAYAFAVGRGFNYISLLFGGFLLAWIIYLWKKEALS